LNRLGPIGLGLCVVALVAPACGSIGNIGDPPRVGTATGAAGTGVVEMGTGAAGGTSSSGTGTAGSPTGSATGAAGDSGSTGAAGATSGAAGAGSGPAGNPGGSTGAAGNASSTGAAGTGAAGKGGAAGAAGVGAAGAGVAGAGAAGAGGSTTVTMPNCKRGEAYQTNSLNDLKALSKGVSWWYNWSTSPEKGVATTFQTSGVEFVPMVWGIKGGLPDPATIEKQIPKGAKYLLGFNEPNFTAQANIPAAQAASLWPRLMQIAKDLNLKLGSPAPNYCAGACNDTDPIHYLDTFFAACTGCQVDFIAAHWYACDGPALTHYLGLLKKYNKPIWLTEFSCMDAGDHSLAGQETYMKTALQILENDPTIFRYSWFTGRWTDPSVAISLLAGDGQLTDLGNEYVTLPATNVCGQ
jgi:hypothetical protein